VKIIQSWWDIQGKGVLASKDIPLVELSRLTLEHNLGTRVIFYTDLLSLSGLSYSNIKPLNMSEYPKEIWCLGKLVAMAQQKEPFIHIDNDIFLWNSTSIDVFNAPFIVFHHEPWGEKCMDVARLIPPPPSLKKGYDTFNTNNFGMIGGTKWKEIVECIQEILDHVKNNKELIVNVANKVGEGWVPVLVEQVWLSELLRKRKIKPKSFLGDKDGKFNPFYNPNLCKLAEDRGVSHYWGWSKKERYNDIVKAYKKWKDYFNSIQYTINNEGCRATT